MRIFKIVMFLFVLLFSASYILADGDQQDPLKIKECNFPENMNCFKNKDIADAEEINANFQALYNLVQELTKKISEQRIECKTIVTTGTQAFCPDGYIVTGCAAGMNRPASASNDNYCQSVDGTDWTQARCCKITQ